MRLRIEIEDQLIGEVMRVTGLKKKRDAVELGLRTLLRLHQQEQLRSLRGALEWQGDLDAMRSGE
jgi:Arc/MetJ family transcription regulator